MYNWDKYSLFYLVFIVVNHSSGNIETWMVYHTILKICVHCYVINNAWNDIGKINLKLFLTFTVVPFHHQLPRFTFKDSDMCGGTITEYWGKLWPGKKTLILTNNCMSYWTLHSCFRWQQRLLPGRFEPVCCPMGAERTTFLDWNWDLLKCTWLTNQ